MTTATLDDLYARADHLGVTPGWVDRAQPIFWPGPRTQFRPAHWAYQDMHDSLELAGGLIDVALAERRNLVLRNPHEGNGFATTRTFACAYQMILPGEVAPTHRHAPHAIRFMLEAEGTYSVVDGERVPMETGDVVLTPGGHWHGHGHDGDAPAYWFDALDIPLVHLLQPMLYEEYPTRYQPISAVTEDSPFRIQRAWIERALDAAAPDPQQVRGTRVVLPADSVPTMELALERLAAGAATRPWRSTANRVVVVAAGKGTTQIDDVTLSWRRGDTVVVPAWSQASHRASADAELFEVSDEPVMRALGYYRTELA